MAPANDVSDEEIAREFQTLRTLRRRSGSSPGPGALPLDPDLPPPSPNSRQYSLNEPSSSSSSLSAFPTYSSDDDVTLSAPDGLEGDAAGLFWVPAHLHPELAPGEFRAFLKSHTHNDPENADASDAGDAEGMARSPSFLARSASRRGDGGLGRKRSMLSRQYQPKIGDNVEDEVPPLPDRQRASIYGGRSGEKGLTLQDLQQLEMIVDEAGESDDPDQMRSLLRRSLSMNVAPGFLQDDIPRDGPDGESTAPSRPGSILRRSARTKIRKAGLTGDGGGHRFAATRKGRMTAAPVIDIPGLEDDDGRPDIGSRRGSDDSGEASKENSFESLDQEDEQYHDAPVHLEERRASDASTDETYIFDAYARDSRSSSMSTDSSSRSDSSSPESSPPGLKLALPSISRSTSGSDWFKDGEKTPTQEYPVDPLQERRASSEKYSLPSTSGSSSLSDYTKSQRSTSPPETPQQRNRPSSQYELPPGMAPPVTRLPSAEQRLPPKEQPQPVKEYTPPPPIPASAPLTRNDSSASTTSTSSTREKEKEKEKEKKGGFFSKKDKDKKGKKEKDGFLGSLFGGKKKTEEPASPVSSFSAAGPAAAAALLGSSKSAKSMGLSPGASPTAASFNNFSRYPIHVERAVYRLSHIKLANARRPLYEQVLISNLMFWYLGVIGRNVAEEKKANSEEEKKEQAKTPPAKGTPPKPTDVGIAGKPIQHQEPEVPPPQPQPSGKKTGLTKPDRRPGGRDAEAPVRTPQYGMQNAQVDSELRSANMGMGMKGPRPPMNQSRPPSDGPPVYQQQQQQQPPAQHVSPPKGQPGPPHHHQPVQNQHQQPFGHLQQQQQQPPRAGPPGPQGGPQRAFSPPGQAGPPPGGQRPLSDHGPSGPRDPRDQRSPPPPGAGFGPSPNGPPNGMPHSQGIDMRDSRQRTYSNPGPAPPAQQYQTYPGQPQGPPGQSGHMRRAVSEARPPPGPAGPPGPERATSPPRAGHAGPQPGQLFVHPQAGSPGPFPPRPLPGGPQPGQRFAPNGPPQMGQPYQHAGPPGSPGIQPGQVFHRPPQMGPPGQQRPPHPEGQRPPQGWDGQQRLPPGAMPPPGPGQPMRRPPPLQPGQTFDGRSYSSPYPQGQGPPGSQGPGPGMSPTRSVGPGFQHPHQGQGPYPGHPLQGRPPGPPQPGQIYSGYQHPAQPQRQPSSEDMYRRAQPVQQGGPYGHHR